ncbi:hypothetical protein ABZV80_40400 [Streptomyces sp. NPDC005132]|uniref:hypothetical protein n=1 Tax=Streptomyces sp. NPDC005132 TaxID=3154294 RepID=UPI0033A0C320
MLVAHRNSTRSVAAVLGVSQRTVQRWVTKRPGARRPPGPLQVRAIERRQQSRGIVADMPGGVELVDRADESDSELGLDLDLNCLAGLQEPVEALEDRHIPAPGARRPILHRQVTDHAGPTGALRRSRWSSASALSRCARPGRGIARRRVRAGHPFVHGRFPHPGRFPQHRHRQLEQVRERVLLAP